jgi:hypothetical protein
MNEASSKVLGLLKSCNLTYPGDHDYVNKMYSHFVVDPHTNEPMRMSDYPSIELLTKRVTFSYDLI